MAEEDISQEVRFKIIEIEQNWRNRAKWIYEHFLLKLLQLLDVF